MVTTLIPIAIIKNIYPKLNQILVTSKGHSFLDLKLPFVVYIEKGKQIKPEELINVLEVSNKKLKSNLFYQMKILDVVKRKQYYVLFYENGNEFFSLQQGNPVYIKKELLNSTKELYFFHIYKKEVYDFNNQFIGYIEDYLEISNNGVLMITLVEERNQKKEIMVPFVPEFVEIKKNQNNDVEKIIVKNLEYFI